MHDFLQQVLDFLRAGFAEVNAIQGLMIGLIAAYLMPAWKRLLYVALAATVVHLVVDIIVPVIVGRTEIHLPPMFEEPFWHQALSLYAGYVVVIALFYFIKTLLIKAGGAK